MTTVEQLTPAAAIAAARAARDEGMAYAELGASDWDRALIDQAIAAFAATGQPFSANDIRPLLPDVQPSLMGPRFRMARQRGELTYLGTTESTKKNTHAKDVGLWIGVPTSDNTDNP